MFISSKLRLSELKILLKSWQTFFKLANSLLTCEDLSISSQKLGSKVRLSNSLIFCSLLGKSKRPP